MTLLKISLLTNAALIVTTAWLIGFNSEHMEQRAIASITDTLDTVSAALKAGDEPKVAQAQHNMTMPPVIDVAELERMDDIDQRKVDVIASILNQN